MGTHPIFESDFDCLTDITEKAVDMVMRIKSQITLVREKMDQQFGADMERLKIAGRVLSNVQDLAGKVDNLQKDSRVHTFLINELMDDVYLLNEKLSDMLKRDPRKLPERD